MISEVVRVGVSVKTENLDKTDPLLDRMTSAEHNPPVVPAAVPDESYSSIFSIHTHRNAEGQQFVSGVTIIRLQNRVTVSNSNSFISASGESRQRIC